MLRVDLPSNIQRQLNSLPRRPGIYIFKDQNNQVLYVGKAVDLARRVGSYFSQTQKLSPAKQLMVGRIATIARVLVKNEQEALLLEANLIKQKQPPFNVVLKEDKRFVYVQLNFNPPQIKPTRFPRLGQDVKIFGPFASVEAVFQTLRALKSALGGGQYLPNLFITPRRGQLLPTINLIKPAAFSGAAKVRAQQIVQEVAEFLSGQTKGVVKKIKQQLAGAAEQRRYELAALLRDQLLAIDRLLQNQEIITAKSVNWDVISLYHEGSRSAVNVFKVRGGKLLDYVVTTLEHRSDFTEAQILTGFLIQYYQLTNDRPQEVVVAVPLNLSVINKQLNQPLVLIAVSRRGVRSHLLIKGLKNAEHHLHAEALRHEPAWDGLAAAKQLALALGLDKILTRIELIDISHLSGSLAVGSLVAAIDGLPASSTYRRFKIRVAKSGDDYAAIKEVVTRRAFNTNWGKPDLIIIDGGAGQLDAARQALTKLKFKVATAAIAKKEELIFTNPHHPPLRLPRRSAALQLVQRLRDEAHRFAITYHRQLRSKQIPKKLKTKKSKIKTTT